MTLAAPHVAPPLLLVPSLARFYSTLAAWAGDVKAVGVPFASLHGGGADMQVCGGGFWGESRCRPATYDSSVRVVLHLP